MKREGVKGVEEPLRRGRDGSARTYTYSYIHLCIFKDNVNGINVLV